MLAATAICLTLLAQGGPEGLEVLAGIVLEKGTGRPLAGVSISFSDDPKAPAATTDAQGQFDWLPEGSARGTPRDGQQGPRAQIRADDERAWRWEFIAPESGDSDPHDIRSMLGNQSFLVQAESRWKGDGAGASLIVECPSVGSIEAIIRGPDGLPLADRPILITPILDPFSPARDGFLRSSGQTDHAGAFRIRSFAGIQQFLVCAPGLGFGVTGRIEVIGGQVARPSIPPLARFARIEGRLAPPLVAPGMKVALLSEPFQKPIGPAAPCDEQGRFALTDVIPGSYRLAASKNNKRIGTIACAVRPEPGQVLGDVVLEPAPAPSPEDRKSLERILRQSNGDRGRIVPWVEGTIRDEKGQPLPGASVYVHVQYDSGLRSAEKIQKTTADEQGRYRFEGPLYPAMGTLTVVAAAKGRPPMVAYTRGPNASREIDELKPAQLDIALGSAGASASMTVVLDGKALPGTSVRLSSGTVVKLESPLSQGSARGPERSQIGALIAPTAKAGPDGVARFDNLLPGAFDLTASDNINAPQFFRPQWPVAMKHPFGIAEGIAIPPGGTIQTAIAIHPQLRTIRFQLLKPDGSPVVGRAVAFGFGLGRATRSTSLDVDEQGIISRDFDRPGLWKVEFQFRDSDHQRSSSLQAEPYNMAEALIPISPGLPLDDPITLRMVRRNPGSIRARLLDAAGRPAKGTVMAFIPFSDIPRRAGAVDAEGSIRFTGLPSGTYRLRGFVDGQAPAPHPRSGLHPLEDAAFLGHAVVFDRMVTLAAGAEESLDLRLEPVGYVRTTLKVPDGRSPSNYIASLKSDGPQDNSRDDGVDREGKSYLFGPIRGGEWRVILREKVDGSHYPKCGERPIAVEPGRIVLVEIEPDTDLKRWPKVLQPRPQAALGMRGASVLDSDPEGFAAKVFLPDGITPAFAARALFFPADERGPTAEGIADATGRLTWTGHWRDLTDRTGKGPEPAKEPTIAAWMPGLTGPVVATVEPDKPPRLVLPAPAGASGRVTLGGRGVEGRNARIRVVAGAVGRGPLAVAFDRATTADPNGRFRFPGLAPGRYAIQAARDDIWLSKSASLVVEPGQDADPIDLDIPEPGAAMAFEFVDEANRPTPGLPFAIRRPEGPLADALPMAYRADDRGSAIVQALETGPQSLIIAGGPMTHDFVVPPAKAETTPQKIRIVVSRPTP